MKPASLALLLCVMAFIPDSLAAQKGADASSGSGPTENQMFDANRQPPLTVLQQLYEKKKVVVFGEPDHQYETTRRLLTEFVKKVGDDPRLRYIALEINQGAAASFEQLSLGCPSADSARKIDLPSYMPTDFMPLVRAINARRPAGQKLIVVPTQVNGEPANADGFWTLIWQRLGPSDKALVLWHQLHIIKRFPGVWGDSSYASGSTRYNNWMEFFLIKHPETEAQMAVVAVDYLQPQPVDTSRKSAQHRLAQRQSARYPSESWGVPLAPFRRVPSVAAERWADRFVPGSTAYIEAARSKPLDVTLPEAEDAIIWEARPPVELFADTANDVYRLHGGCPTGP